MQPATVFRRNPVGFVRAIPDGVVTNLSVMRSERTGEQLLLQGPLRFVNSDCNPNVEYDYSSDLGVVQLRVKRKIKPGDELFVKYGDEFFESNCCLCRTCLIKSKEKLTEDNVFEILFEEVLEHFCTEIYNEIYEDIDREHSTKNRKRRRVKGREMIERYNELTNSPLSCDESPERDQLSSQIHISDSVSSHSLQKSLFENPCSERHIDSSDSNPETPTAIAEDNEYQSDFGDNDSLNTSFQRELENGQNARASSPLRQQVSFCCSVSSVSADHSIPTLVPASDQLNSVSEKLFPGSRTSVEDASSLADLFCSKFNLSDECSSTLYSIIKGLLPEENKFPSGYSRIKKIKDSFQDSVRVLQKNTGNAFCVLKFRFQIGGILKRSLSEISKHSDFRRGNPDKDFNPSFCPIADLNQSTVVINLIFFTDGVNIKKSTYKKEIWPIWVQIADLPPKIRSARKNIVLAALAVSNSFPSWNDFVYNLKDELATGLLVEISENLSYKFLFKARLLIADFGAKNHVLNMMKFNGFYGCHICTAKGITIGRTHAYYPFNQPGEMRECWTNDIYVNTAETLSVKKNHKCCWCQRQKCLCRPY